MLVLLCALSSAADEPTDQEAPPDPAAIGTRTASEWLAITPGVIVEQDRFALLRGQSARYTETTLNGSPFPSFEPLVRTLPLDLLPTSVLSNVEVHHSYSADRLASSGAGLIDLQIQEIPAEPFFEAMGTLGGNSVTRFGANETVGLGEISDVLGGDNGRVTYDGGAFDWLGFDDGTRGLPPDVVRANERAGDLTGLPVEQQTELGRQFTNIYRLRRIGYQPDASLGLAGGSRLDLPGSGRLGALASIQWQNLWRHQARAQRGFAVGVQPDTLLVRDDLVENRTDRNVNLGGLLHLQAEWDDHEISTSTVYGHFTQQRAQLTTGLVLRADEVRARNALLSWIEREMIAQQLRGRHAFGDVVLEYRGLLGHVGRDAPDQRTFGFIDRVPSDGNYIVAGDSGATRQFGELSDAMRSVAADLHVPLLDSPTRGLGLKAKVGVAASGQRRRTQTRLYAFAPTERADLFETDPEVLFDPSQVGPEGTVDFFDFSQGARDDNVGTMNTIAGYGLLDAQLGSRVELRGGLRYERARLSTTTFARRENEDGARVVDETYAGGFGRCFESLGGNREAARQRRAADCALYPSVAATVHLGEPVRVHLAYGRTTSRPLLNELSEATFVEPESGERFSGNGALLPAVLNGVDARIAWAPSDHAAFTIGGFFKDYTNPIERSFAQVGGTNSAATFQNTPRAQVWGLDAGGRVRFGSVFAGAHVNLLDSTVGDVRRPLDGQVSYAAQIQAGYAGEEHQIAVRLSAVGRRLWRVGVPSFQPDIFLQPLETLDATWNWRLWETERNHGGLRLTLANVLDTRWAWHQGQVSDGSPGVWRDYRRGFTANLGFQVGLN